ncbi:MAG: TlpA disulfide reductase family protein [Acidobacteriota bacterium]|jgi:thiol-disulfide isomerase/thioredoxin
MNRPADQIADTAPATLETPAGAGEGTTARRLSLQARIFTIAVALLAAAVLFWPRGAGNEEAPGGFLIDAGGRPVPVAARMAPVTLVHFWATWCPPCMTEVPSLDRLADDFAEYLGDFTILMVAVDDDRERVEDFVGDRASSVLYDPSWEVTHRYGTRKLPETYLVVRGTVKERWIGPQDWGDEDIRAQIREAIDGLRSGSQTASL